MSKKKPLDKAQARERRNRMLDAAAAARLSLTEGVREMRAIAGMTQEEFAQHRGVSARVIKAIELGQGNPTVATLNRIGQFFGLEVAFVPIKRTQAAMEQPQDEAFQNLSETVTSVIMREIDEQRDAIKRQLDEALLALENAARSLNHGSRRAHTVQDDGVAGTPSHKKRKPRSP